ncbi:hybrid sensor histidine kinase/response regulator [Caenimonas aquaedulcis]|uniref:Chemotaxis protein CheA n=1 Tax=Caenimonas aquaedulcis TaxID=2793270 RepID=A0A931H6R4_9BURK|nr:Hpt domain-containing protein [Caenimonas aquaedulcis]MBG9389487.1 Hpt domain-containing protein [Caenimonas aquaedulcis]
MEAATDIDLATNDLGPLAWVLDELRKSLDSASAALRRFVRDTAMARGTDMASVDGGHLRIARQQLHQAVGALEMVGLGAPAHMLRCMEAAVQKFVEHPEQCSEAASAKVERAGFALTEYLESVLLGKAASSVALFPQYKDVQELAGSDRIHPADLWSMEWRWNDPQSPAVAEVRVYDPAVRSRMDQSVLKLVKTGDAEAASELTNVSLSLAATQTARQPKIFWKICAAYFEAVGKGLLPLDIYVKRAGSRVLLQYASLAKGELGVSDRLAQDLVFFCSQAVPKSPADAPALAAVRQAWGLARFTPVDYQTPQFGRFDPILLSQSRKRIAAAKETWSALSGGDVTKLKGLADQFQLVSDSLVKLYPPSAPLAQALTQVVDSIVRTARAPGPELAMEVATAVLYLEAAFEDLDPADNQLAVRTARLAERLDTARQGGHAEALEPWMEELYRRVSDRQTMGSVVGELRGTLGELEKLLDQFFRNSADKTPLRDAPGHLSQMRGVLSVLGLDQAAQAVLRMRECVEEIIVTEVDEQQARAAGTFDKLGNNLGALGFLIDMLNYQPSLAKKLFVYDDSSGELRPLMGRTGEHAPEHTEEPDDLSSELQALTSMPEPESREELTAKLDSIAAHAVLADQSGIAQTAREASAAVTAHDSTATAAALNSLAAAAQPVAPPPVAAPAESGFEEDDLRDIFLEEAREVVQNGLAAIHALAAAPADVGELTTLRRAFHTLKGSSRMVGLNEYGEAAWSMEQVLNTWLADQKPANDNLRTLAGDAMRGFARWTEDIATNSDGAWKSAQFRGPADALRTEQRLVALVLPGEEPVAQPAEPAAEAPQAQVNFEATAAFEPAAAEPEPESEPSVPAMVELPSMDLPTAEATRESPIEAVAETPASAPAVPELELPADFSLELEPAAVAGPATVELPAPAEIEGIDFDSLAAISGPAQAAQEVVAEASPGPALDADLDFSFEEAAAATEPEEISLAEFELLAAQPLAAATEAPAGQQPEPQPEPEPEPVVEPPDEVPDDVREPIDEQVKVIGNLRIGIPLYNVYLNEADEWSRRLATEVTEWSLELSHPVLDSTVGLAHALAGSSATVGFHALSDIARALESALVHTQSLAFGLPQHGKAFTEAAEEIRRLLHQFAAGFLKEPDAGVISSLVALKDLDVPLRTDAAEEEELSDFGGLEAPVSAPQALPEVAEAVAPVVAAPVVATPVAQAPVVQAPAPTVAPAFIPPVMPEVAQARPARLVEDFSQDQDQIDIEDAVDPDLFPIFEEEAAELLPQLGGALRQWSARPDNRSARDEVLRALHTLKGSARLAGALRLGERAHRMESEIESIGSENAAATDLEGLLHRFDEMQGNFDAMRATGGLPVTMDDAQPAPAAPESASGAPAMEDMAPVAAPAADAPPSRALIARPVTTNLVQQRAAANQAVRVRSQLLDRLVNQAGEVMITRSRLEAELRQLRGSLTDLTGNLDRLRSQLRDIELQAESQMQSRLAQAKDSAAGFDPLEFDRFTRVQELTRMMAESVNDVATVQRNLQRTVESTEDDLIAQARQTRELQRDLLRTRMVEFEGISDRLYRVIRLASKETGKQVKLDITGGSIEMDRGVLDRMTPAFEHLLRNCVAHGIEEPSVRAAAGKDPSGTILIHLAQEGNDVSVEFRDDGGGLDLARIRAKAMQQGLITPGQELSDADAANLIFTPGFSTATAVTELAGRGIGMDVVRSEVNALGGRIETNTATGKGTSFKLVLPLTTAVTQVVMIRSGTSSIGVPANVVEVVRRAPAKDVEQAYNTGFYEMGGEQIPFYWSGALLQASQRSVEPQTKTLPVVVFRSAAQRVALHVDEVLGNQEVVVKNLGPQLARLPGLAGMSVLASGAVVLIYNPVALTAVYGEQARLMSADHAQPHMLEKLAAGTPTAPAVPAAPVIPLILVVDDSITVRRVTQRLLAREGYRVAMAADGLQALERLAEEKPTVVLSDIEMPRMDGFDLARNIRADERLKDLPIIMITSRIAEKHREHARELGVDHYLGKPYSEEELLSLVKHYCAQTIAA